MDRSTNDRAGLTPGNISDRAQCGKRPSRPISSGNLMNQLTSAQERVLACLRGYRQASSRDQEAHVLFANFVSRHPDCCERTLAEGHLTGSAWLVSADGQRVLLTHHRKLDRWLQLGGHAEGDPDLAAVALREAQEESGIDALSIEGDVFDLDRHLIPARGDDPAHWHYDVRFVVRAFGDESFTVSDESHDLAWRHIDELASDASVDESVRRMALKWISLRS